MRTNKKIKITKASQAILQIAIMIIATFAFAFLISAPRAEAAVQADYCCEKTDAAKYGRAAWCVNTKKENCDANYKNTPSSCDATSFCKPGCCYESGEGLCMENSPQLVCNQNNGSWSESAECEIPQCRLGCCVLDNQAALVTLSRCKRLSGIYGMPIDFITNIQDEVQCIALTQLKDRGACVYEEDFIAKCKFTTRELCQGIKSTGNLTSSRFHKDKLCSDPDLGTICGMPDESNVKTTCIEGKDEVYFVDTCGNPANIYDALKVKEPSYWKEVVDKSESCNANSANANSKDCGNCDYYLGSICQKSERTNRASYGDYMCQDLNCYDTSDGKDHKHGESWCSYDGNTGEGADSVGSRHFRHLCVGGEEIIEACEDYRKETCIETTTKTSSGEFQEAACRGNRWDKCIAQDEKEDCENTDKRDCYWLEGISFPKEITQQVKEKTSEEESGESGLKIGGGACLPNVPPGLKFWAENSPECSVANTQCIVTFEKGVFSEEEATDNKECLEESWAQKMNQVCYSLGDCGGYVNWQGKYTDDGYKWKVDGKKKTISQGIVNEIKKKAGV